VDGTHEEEWLGRVRWSKAEHGLREEYNGDREVTVLVEKHILYNRKIPVL
jgi:hypothetical protein